MNFRSDWDAMLSLTAVGKSQAVIEFNMLGRILSAKSKFCDALGYELMKSLDGNHSLFVDPVEAGVTGMPYILGQAQIEFDQRHFRRNRKGDREVWIQASYNPIYSGNSLSRS